MLSLNKSHKISISPKYFKGYSYKKLHFIKIQIYWTSCPPPPKAPRPGNHVTNRNCYVPRERDQTKITNLSFKHLSLYSYFFKTSRDVPVSSPCFLGSKIRGGPLRVRTTQGEEGSAQRKLRKLPEWISTHDGVVRSKS